MHVAEYEIGRRRGAAAQAHGAEWTGRCGNLQRRDGARWWGQAQERGDM